MLDTISPLNTLKRGYAIATDPISQRPITQTSQTNQGARVAVQLLDGRLDCTVEHITPATFTAPFTEA